MNIQTKLANADSSHGKYERLVCGDSIGGAMR